MIYFMSLSDSNFSSEDISYFRLREWQIHSHSGVSDNKLAA